MVEQIIAKIENQLASEYHVKKAKASPKVLCIYNVAHLRRCAAIIHSPTFSFRDATPCGYRVEGYKPLNTEASHRCESGLPVDVRNRCEKSRWREGVLKVPGVDQTTRARRNK